MLANQRRHSRPETHVRSGGREFGEFAVQRLSQVSGALGTPRAGGWRQAESRTHSPCRGAWGLRGSQQPWGAGGRLRGRGAPGVRCPEPRCARPGGARCLGPGPHPAPRRGRGAAATAPCRALSSWRSPNSAATQPARPGVRGTRGKSDEQVPVLGPHPPSPPATRQQGPADPRGRKAPRCPVACQEAGFSPGVRTPSFRSLLATWRHLRGARGSPAPAHRPRVCAHALGAQLPPAQGGGGCDGETFFSVNYEKSDPGTGFTSTSLAPAGFGAVRAGSPPAAGLRGPRPARTWPAADARQDANRGGAGGGGRRPAAQARSWPRPGAGAGAGAQTAFRPPRSPLGDGGPGSLGSALRANISSGTCASAPSGIVSEVNVRAACTWTPGGSSMKILYAPYVSAPEDALSRPPQPRNEENGSPRRNSLSRA